MKVLTVFITDKMVKRVKLIPVEDHGDGTLSCTLVYNNNYYDYAVDAPEFKFTAHGNTEYNARLGSTAGIMRVLSASLSWSFDNTNCNDMVTYKMIFTPFN